MTEIGAGCLIFLVHPSLPRACRNSWQDMEPTGPSVKAFNDMYRAELARWTKVARMQG